VGIALNRTAILVVDDDRDTRELLEELIAGEGAIVRSAMGAHEALEILRTWTPDVILLDLSMPEMDGLELLTIIRDKAHLRAVPAVAITGYDDASDRKRCLDAGFVAHVTKPFDVEALIKRVATLVPHRHAASA
jgi:two-component system CheB/CheR fusion protein